MCKAQLDSVPERWFPNKVKQMLFAILTFVVLSQKDLFNRVSPSWMFSSIDDSLELFS
jgi:hypothetical protein